MKLEIRVGMHDGHWNSPGVGWGSSPEAQDWESEASRMRNGSSGVVTESLLSYVCEGRGDVTSVCGGGDSGGPR